MSTTEEPQWPVDESDPRMTPEQEAELKADYDAWLYRRGEKDRRIAALEAEILSLREARDTAEQEAKKRRACMCQAPDPVMQADSKFYCHTCSFETGARPSTLFLEAQLAAVDAERIALRQEVEELRATIGTLDAL